MIATAIDIRLIGEQAELEQSYKLRRDIFMDEQSVTEEEEFDGLDDTCTHYLAKVAGIVAGTVRLREISIDEIKIERLCVAKDYRGHGVGRQIMKKILKDIQDKNIKTVLLSGQTHALGFYQSFGFKPYGDEFMDARIPHRNFKLEL
ncbi:MAG: putative GNAT family N-acyltransferase [Alphaproteobacteria bacterium]|jgi:predicted GNAT family N-acyltransferase